MSSSSQVKVAMGFAQAGVAVEVWVFPIGEPPAGGSFDLLWRLVILSNSSPKSKVQTSVLGLGVDFVFPLSQQEEQQEEQQEQQQEPPPKSIRRGCTRSL